MQLDVPFHSQYEGDVPKEWRTQSCGIVALKMALDFYTPNVPSVAALIQEGVAQGGYLDDVGWKHDALVALAKEYGVSSWRGEYKDDKQKGVGVCREMLEKGVLPITSVATDHENPETFHLVVLVGCDDSGLYYHDPAGKSEDEGRDRCVKYSDFETYWRGLAIFVSKSI